MEKLDKERYLKRVIVVCWIALGICFGIKLFGGNLFEIMCNNENFIKVCEYADNNWWANILISFIVCLAHLYFYVLAICRQARFDKIQLYIVVATAFIGTFIKVLTPPIFGIIFDIWQLMLMPFLFLEKGWKSVLRVLIANVLLFGFQLISMVTKNIGVSVLGESVLEGTIFSLDVILMIILYWGYSNFKRKEKNNG
ncbi:MAG: hypothetical protein J6V20_01470 [Bacteroidaceae bacterium]|nr:hypothetical protein [Bacteroidaceae bacterium]